MGAEQVTANNPRAVLTLPEDTMPDFARYLESRGAAEETEHRAIVAANEQAIADARACLLAKQELLDDPGDTPVSALLEKISNDVAERVGNEISEAHDLSLGTHERSRDAVVDELDRSLASKLQHHLEAHVESTIAIPNAVVSSVLQPTAELGSTDTSPVCDPRVLRNALSSKVLLLPRTVQDAPGSQVFDIVPVVHQSTSATLRYRTTNPEQVEVYIPGSNRVTALGHWLVRCFGTLPYPAPSMRLDVSNLPYEYAQRREAWYHETNGVFDRGAHEVVLGHGSYNTRHFGPMDLPCVRDSRLEYETDQLLPITDLSAYTIQPDLLEKEDSDAS